MGLISEQDRIQLQGILKSLENDVKIILFTQEFECQHCKTAREMLEEVSGLSDKVLLEVYDFVKDKELADSYAIDKIPGILIIGAKDYGIRFFGVPAGYEFTTFIEDVISVSRRDSDLPGDVLSALARIQKPVHIQVLVSPTCPYCAHAVRTAHRFAIASDQVSADMVELSEFPHISVKYEVQGVPKVVINEQHSFTGSKKEDDFADFILKALEG